MRKTILVTLLSSTYLSLFAQFTNVAASTGTDHGSVKDGGVSWGDLNNDGCLDLVFNTNENSSGNRSRILISNCSLPNPSFTDVTATHCSGFTDRRLERSISIGDYNNDGYLDITRNTSNRFEVYLNKGPLATPAYSFGDDTQDPSFEVSSIPGGMNTEGFGWVDYNNDGYLDLLIENHQYGIDIYENPADGSANFFHVTPDGDTKGFPEGCGDFSCSGDYMALTDFDNDGDVDAFARKQDPTSGTTNNYDLWTNNGDGTFSHITTFDELANNSNKGGVLFCDFDNDGDFDLFWTSNGTNQIFEQTGFNSGNFAATNEPATSAGVSISNTIDGCSCGDVDNDGDMDLFLGGSDASNSYLFVNNGSMDFTRDNRGILPAGNTEGHSFGDYDNDGDLDLYINVDGGNELWRNSTNDSNYLKVHVKRDLGSGVLRDDLGATAVLKDCDGNILSGIREVNGTKGHGSQDPAIIHFGLPNGRDSIYLVEVRFTTVMGVRGIRDIEVIPSSVTNQTITMVSPTGTGSFNGCSSTLPVEKIDLKAKHVKRSVELKWNTSGEGDNYYFTIERSKYGKEWKEIGKQYSKASNGTYRQKDNFPLQGISYYRIKQADYKGNVSYSNIETINSLNHQVKISMNRHTDNVAVEGNEDEIQEISVYNIMGKNVTSDIKILEKSSSKVVFNISAIKAGTYLVKTKTGVNRIIKD